MRTMRLMLILAVAVTATLQVRANTLQYETYGSCGNNTTGPGTTVISSTPLNESGTCAITGGTASYSAMVGFEQMGSAASVSVGGSSSAQEQANTYFDDYLNVGGTSTGTPVLLNFTVNWSGTYQYSSTGSVNGEIYQSQTISVNDNVLLGRTYTDGGLQKIEICTEAAGCGDPNPSPGIEFLNTPSGSGQVSYRASASYLVTTGSSIHFHWVFQNIVNFGAGVLSASDDFYDPAQLNITATDPSTGDAVTGVTLTGSDGTPYLGANKTKPPATVPEPSSLILMVSGLTAAGALRRRSVS